MRLLFNKRTKCQFVGKNKKTFIYKITFSFAKYKQKYQLFIRYMIAALINDTMYMN